MTTGSTARLGVLTLLVTMALLAQGFGGAVAAHAEPLRSSPGAGGGPINDLAKTPYLGWNTYYGLGSDFGEKVIEGEADAIVDRGLRSAGYEYVWIDGGWWNGARGDDGQIQVDASQWPHGMKAVADYIHARGLKAGIYTDAGADGCGGAHQGSLGHYQQDADTFAAWGYDAVKVDFCGGRKLGLDPAAQYAQFRDALLANSSRRPMLFNICNPFVPETGAPAGQSAYDSWKFGPTTGNSWRTDTDIGFVRNVQYHDVLRNLDHDAVHPEAAGPGHWNDPDYLGPEMGLTSGEARAQMSMWSILAAPLIVGSDVRTLSQRSIDMLTNQEVLAIDQDSLGRQGTAISSDGDTQVWSRRLADGSRAVALFNRGETAATISTTAAAVGLPHAGAYRVRDVWAHTTRESGGGIAAAVAPHTVELFRVSARTDPAATPPLVTLAPVSTPAPYAGSQLRLAVPGQSLTVTSSIRNDGRLPIADAAVTLDVPEGWQVRPAQTQRIGRLAGGRQQALTWEVAVPASAPAGEDRLTVRAGYTWGDGGHHETGSSTASVQVPPPPPSGETVLSHHDWLSATSGWLTPKVDQAVGGGPLAMNGTTYSSGIGVASPSTIAYYLGGKCDTLAATVGIDDSTNFDPSGGTASFRVAGDGQTIYDSGLISRPTVRQLTVPMSGRQVLVLEVGDGGDGGYNDRTDWADVHVRCAS